MQTDPKITTARQEKSFVIAANIKDRHHATTLLDWLRPRGYDFVLECGNQDVEIWRHGSESDSDLRVVIVSSNVLKKDPYNQDWLEVYSEEKEWHRTRPSPIIVRVDDVELPHFLFGAIALLQSEIESSAIVDVFRNPEQSRCRLFEALGLEERSSEIDVALAMLVHSRWSFNLLAYHAGKRHSTTPEALREVDAALDADLARLLSAVSSSDPKQIECVLSSLEPQRIEKLLSSRLAGDNTVLHIAVTICHDVSAIKRLLAAGADPNAKNNYLVTPLILGAWSSEGTIEALLDAGGDPSMVGRHGENALGPAAWRGLRRAVQLLMARGGDPFVTDCRGGHAAAWAAMNSQHDILRDILEKHKDDVDVPTGVRGWGATHARGEELALTRYVIERFQEQPHTALQLACQVGVVESVRVLLDHGANPNVLEPVPPLLLSLRASREDDVVALVSLLLEKDANPDVSVHGRPLVAYIAGHRQSSSLAKVLHERGARFSEDGKWTLLHFAASVGDVELIKYLIESSMIAVEALDSAQETALLVAVHEDQVDAVRSLLHLGASIEASTKDGKSALRVAIDSRSWRTVGDLISAQAKLGRVDGALMTLIPSGKAMLLSKFLDSLPQDAMENETLRAASAVAAAAVGDVTRLAKLLDSGASANDSYGGWRPLAAASFAGRNEVVALLLEKNADADVCDGVGMTALHLAAREGHIDVTKVLLSKTHALKRQDHAGYAPIDYALMARRREIIEMLQQEGADPAVVVDRFVDERPRLIREAERQDDVQANVWSHGAIGLHQIALPFYDDAILVWPMNTESSFAIHSRTGHKMVGLSWKSDSIYNANSEFGWCVDSVEKVESYVRFFMFFVRAEEGQFRVVETQDDIPWSAATYRGLRDRVAKSLQRLEISLDGHLFTAKMTLLYGRHLFHAVVQGLRVRDLSEVGNDEGLEVPKELEIGQLWMSSDEIVEPNLPVLCWPSPMVKAR